MAHILHVDMDAFFVAAELLRHPELRDKPVVVGGRGDPTRRGVVSTASYEARRYGVRSAMPLRTAFKRCPHAVFLPVELESYRQVSRKIKRILADFKARTHGLTLETPTDEPEVIRAVARECLQDFELEKPVRLIGVRVGGLVKSAGKRA